MNAPQFTAEFASIDEVRKFAAQKASMLKAPTLVLLSGPLGVGKTTLVREFVQVLGATEASSPTYSIYNMYRASAGDIYHVDLYRIEGGDDLESTGFWDLFAEKNSIIFVEWPERISEKDWPHDWPLQQWRFNFSQGGTVRRLEIFAK